MKHKDTPQPGIWRSVNQTQIKDWRKKVRDDLATKPKGSIRYEFDTGRTQGLGEADTNLAGDAVMEQPKPLGIRDARDTVETLIQGTLDWVREAGSKDELRRRVAILQHSGKMSHMSLDEATSQMYNLAEKLAVADAERVYNERGLNRPVQI